MTTQNAAIRIGIIDPNPVLHFSLQCFADHDPDFIFVMAARDGREGFKAVLDQQPDIVLSEVDLDFRSIFDVMVDVRPRGVRTRFILYSHETPDVYIGQAIRAGAKGYLSKNETPDRLATAIHAVARGDYAFSSEVANRITFDRVNGKPVPQYEDRLSGLGLRPLEAVRHLSRGYSVKEVARLMGVTEKSVASHQYRAYGQLDVHDRVALARMAAREGVVGLGSVPRVDPVSQKGA